MIADIGAFTLAHPPATDFFVPSGVQYAIENFRNGFLVTDGHHNRVYRVTLDGPSASASPSATSCRLDSRSVTARSSWRRPDRLRTCRDGRIVKFRAGSNAVAEVARGGRLLVDVEFGAGDRFALAQGHFTPGTLSGRARGSEHRSSCSRSMDMVGS